MARRRLVDQDRQREQLRQQMLLDRIARSVERILAREIASTMRDMVKAWQATGRVDKIPEHERRVESTLRMAWRASIEGFARRISEAAQAKGKHAPLIAKNADHWELFVQEYLQEFGGQKIVEITDTTLMQVLNGIAIGRANGLGQADIAKQIAEKAPSIGRARAAVIARTETHSAANYGALAQAEDTGLDMMKEWISTTGARTRDSHRDADGQTVPTNEPFIVGGARLRFPGDPRGPAEEVINCRCNQGFIVLD